MIGIVKDVEADSAGRQSVGEAAEQLQPQGFGAEKQDEGGQEPDGDSELNPRYGLKIRRILPKSLR